MREKNITEILSNSLQPSYMEVVNESDSHQGPPGRESHFKLVVVSEKFFELSRIERHQLVYKLVDAEFKSGLHALALKLFTKIEWEKNQGKLNLNSPNCKS